MDYKNIQVPWGEIGYITFKRTYARRLKEDDLNSKTEEFWQVVQREIESSDKQLHVGFTEKEKMRYAELRMNLKFSTAGRFMWQLGTKTVDKLGLPSLQNCAFTVVNDPIRPFTWCFEMLMLGSGVGYNIQKHNVYQLPKLKGKVKIERKDVKDADFIVPDTREGWVKLLGKVLKAHFYSGESFTYSTQLIRSKGALIRGFGGTASGPEDLCWGISEISKILNSRSNKKLRPIDCLDIMNIIGFVVVAGNVRRSAQISIGDYDDIEYLKSKRWDLGPIPKWRSMSNNSIVAPENIDDLTAEFWDTYNQGEPYGLINLELARSIGRTGESQYPDPDVEGFNPCAEQSLANFETCCLAEVYLSNIDSYDELLEVLQYTYRMNKHSLALHCSLKETEDIVHKNMRMGIGMTGILQATEEQRSWLKDAYVWLRNYDKEYSAKHGFPESIKLTTVKPSGCQRHDTLLITDGGILQLDEIGDVNGEQWQEHEITISQEHSQEKSTKFFVNGLSSTKKILMSSGIEIESTENHQYRILENGKYVWKAAEDISIGDTVPFKLGGYVSEAVLPLKHIEHRNSTNVKTIKQPNELNNDLAWLLGLYFGDGSTHKKGIRIAGDINKRDILERALTIVKDQFGVNPIIYDRTSSKNNSDLYVNSQELLDFLRLNDLIKQKSKDLEFPLIIRQSGRQIIASFIDGYAHADGSFKTNGLSFCTISKKWATQLVIILRSIGKDAKMRMMPPTESSKGENMRYWVSVRKGKDVERRYISKEKRDIWEQLETLGLNDFSYDTVVSVEEGLIETYDIEVPNNNCYIANSYVSHNTLSLLAGVTPGVHPNPAGPHYIRRIRISSESKLIDVCKKHGYHLEYQRNFDGSEDRSTMVISFPCKLPETTPVAADFDWKTQMDMIRKMQAEWSDNSVSCTVYYKKEDIEDIKAYLKKHFRNEIKTVSFLLYYGHGFDQAPYETISKEVYYDMKSVVKPITSVEIREDEFDIIDCATGACPVK